MKGHAITAWLSVLYRRNRKQSEVEASYLFIVLDKAKPFVAAARSGMGCERMMCETELCETGRNRTMRGEWKRTYGKTERREGRLRIAMRYGYG